MKCKNYRLVLVSILLIGLCIQYYISNRIRAISEEVNQKLKLDFMTKMVGDPSQREKFSHVLNKWNDCNYKPTCYDDLVGEDVKQCTWYIHHRTCSIPDSLQAYLSKHRIEHYILSNSMPQRQLGKNCINTPTWDHQQTCVKQLIMFQHMQCDKCVVKIDSDLDLSNVNFRLGPNDYLGSFDGVYHYFGASPRNVFGLFVGIGKSFCQRIKDMDLKQCLHPYIHDDQVFGFLTDKNTNCVDLNGQNVIRENEREIRFFLNLTTSVSPSCPTKVSIYETQQ